MANFTVTRNLSNKGVWLAKVIVHNNYRAHSRDARRKKDDQNLIFNVNKASNIPKPIY